MAEPVPSQSPPVSVIVCTRNRAREILRAANSILASDYPHFELLIVDQGDDDTAANALAPLLNGRPPLRYLRLASKGKAKALNYAWRHACGQYLALTDDDCEMAPDCLSTLVTAFQAEPRLGVIFGRVAAAPHDTSRDHIPKWDVHESNTIRRPADFVKMSPHRGAPWLNFGIGANMAIRSSALRLVEGWDPCIGPGHKFGSGDDHDLAFRLLRAGFAVSFSPAAHVIHHGARPLKKMHLDSRRVGRGFGAACIKYLKCGVLYHGSARTLPYHLVRFCLHPFSPRHFYSATFILGWLSGFQDGLVHPVNKRTQCFEDNRC